MSHGEHALLSVAMSLFWFWIAWRSLKFGQVAGFKREGAGYWIVVALLLVFGAGAATTSLGHFQALAQGL